MHVVVFVFAAASVNAGIVIDRFRKGRYNVDNKLETEE